MKKILTILIAIIILLAIIQMDNKVYEQEVIVETPFPSETGIPGFAPTVANAVGTYTPTTTKEKTIPKKKLALELLSTALNTRSKKILQEFDLADSGGLKIGNFKEGLSGDLRITPNGLTARDIAGLTTFAIDGLTGSAVFRGEIRAADFVISDENGLISLNNFNSGYIDNSNVLTITPGGVYVEVDVTGGGSPLVVEFDLTRESNVQIFFNASGRCTVAGGFQLVAIYEDGGSGAVGTAPFTQLTGHSRISGAINDTTGSMGVTTASQTKIVTLGQGHHRLALRHRSTGSNSCIIQDMTIGFVVLGR
jgi:hypothetical protein